MNALVPVPAGGGLQPWPPELTVACVLRSGGQYAPVHVLKLCRQVRRWLAAPHAFLCLADTPVPGVDALPLQHDWPGWWAKVELFAPEGFSGRVLYLDLDVLVLGPLDDLAAARARPLRACDDFYWPGHLNSSVLLWTAPDYAELYADFAPWAAERMRRFAGGSDQTWFETRAGEWRPLQPEFPGRIRSYKADRAAAWPPCPINRGKVHRGEAEGLSPEEHVMESWVQIANLALSRLGTRQIADLGEASAEARAIVGVLTTVCDSVLRAHPWNCALARAVLATDAEAPAFEYACTYTLPTDPYCLRVLGIWNSTEPWMVEGRKLLTDHPAPLPLRYLRRVTDPEQLDGAFIAAFAERLAHAVCPVLTPSLEREGALWSSSERLVREARSLDGPRKRTRRRGRRCSWGRGTSVLSQK